MTPRLLSTGQLAAHLGVSRGAVLVWAKSAPPRLVPVITTPGGHHRWSLEDALRQLAARTW